MPDSAAPFSAFSSPADAPEPPAEVAPPLPSGCLRQAAASVPAAAVVPQPICKAKACPGNCRRKRASESSS